MQLPRDSIRRRFPTWLMVVVLLLIGVPVWACSVPVFRYALERWESDPYQVVVFHRGALDKEQQALVDVFGSTGLAGQKFANVSLETVDLAAEPDDEMLALWESQGEAELPWVVARYPMPWPAAWVGPLTDENANRLLESPVRQEIARRILKGETAVWIFLESGDQAVDDAAYAKLAIELPIAELELELPEIEEQDITDGLVEIDPDELKIDFSSLRLSRDDPAEAILIEMLLGSEGGGSDGLRDPELINQPMAFPVFGRGRVLYGLVGAGISRENIMQACKELIGPCTCQVKDQNPGIDLLMAVNWDGLIDSQIEIDKELPPLSGLASFSVEQHAEPAADAADQQLAVAATDEPTDRSSNAVSSNGSSEKTEQADPSETSSDSHPIPATERGGMSAVVRNVLVLIAVSVVGIFAASFLFVGKKG